MLKHLYEARRNGHKAIFGTILGGLSAFWELVLIKILWNKKIRFWGISNIHKNPFPHPYNIPIRNGYALVLLSWAFVIWWALVTVFLIVFYFCIGFACAVYFAIWLACFFGISVFYIPALVYSIFPELPASIANKDLLKIDKRKSYEVKRQIDWGIVIPSLFPILGWIIALCVIAEHNWNIKWFIYKQYE